MNKDPVMQSLRFISKSTLLHGILFLLTLSFIFNTVSARAESTNAEKIDIPVIEGARVFAKFDEKTPAVLNYFTSVTEVDVVDFYNKNYGEPIQRERKRGHLTLNYQHGSLQIRVIISLQGKLRQVDVIVDES
tara:strand:+ start:9895 stop:10293 length:399 start_codon:yes stop_codon:yes gene_type:complete